MTKLFSIKNCFILLTTAFICYLLFDLLMPYHPVFLKWLTASFLFLKSWIPSWFTKMATASFTLFKRHWLKVFGAKVVGGVFIKHLTPQTKEIVNKGWSCLGKRDKVQRFIIACLFRFEEMKFQPPKLERTTFDNFLGLFNIFFFKVIAVLASILALLSIFLLFGN